MSSALRVILVEDEPFAQQELKRLLKASGHEIHIIDCIDSVEDAVTWFESNTHPDLVFMDIQLTDGLSFQIFEKTTINAPVIFTTAFDEYAIQAFKVNSIDYLLKPVEPEALENAILKFQSLRNSSSETASNISETQLLKLLEATTRKGTYKSRFIAKIGDQIKYVDSHEIAYFHAEDNVVFMVTKAGKRYIVEYTLNELFDFLNPKKFYRLNRSYFACIDAISGIHKFFNSRLKIELTPSVEEDILVSRVKVSEFLEWIES